MPDYGHGEIFKKQYRRVDRLPSGRLQAYDVYGGKVAPDAKWAVCDCCCGRYDRLWKWEQYGFSIPKACGRRGQIYDAGQWAMCVACKVLFDQGRLDLLMARAITMNPDLDRGALETLYSLLPFVLHGEPTEWKL